MKFKYEKLLAGRGPSFTDLTPVPIIKINLHPSYPNYACLVDSGADYTIFHADIGRAIFGLKIEDGKKKTISGITSNQFIGYIHKIKYKLGGWEYEAEVVFADGLGTPVGVLGRSGFFEFFVVKITHIKESIELKDLTR